MPLAQGTKLGPYEITGPLGAGGMGEVYRAKDTRLERTVAVKILPAHLSSDPVRKQRFEREAKAISGLSHPHICVLYDVGHQDGIDFLVMECVDGETLTKRLEKGPLPLEQVVKYGAQIAGALDKAHRGGVVHRDLKPGNIMLTPAGAKLLDFGLARPVAVASSGVTLTATSASSPVTEQGTIVGTFQYMSPEQVEGKELDGRSDIFSLGAVLYEMLTGKRAFNGKSQLSVASAILEREPAPIATTKPLTPPTLEHVISKCLAKAPDERWQSASDLASELKWISESGADVAALRPPPARWRLPWGTALIALVAIALAALGMYYFTRTMPEPPLVALIAPPHGVFADTFGRIGPPRISPDGTRIAFIGCKTESAALSMLGGKDCSIWLRALATGEAREIPGTSSAYYPFWSPDGVEIAFFADGKLKKVSADGGPLQVICDAPDARGGSWGRFGRIIFAPTRVSPIVRVSAEGGEPVAITKAVLGSERPGTVGARWPQFLPDGEHFLYVNAAAGACTRLNELRYASIDGAQDVSLMRTCSSAAFANGHLLYWRDGNLVAQPFEPHRGALSGTPSAIAEHADFQPIFSLAEFSVSTEGKLIYVAGDAALNNQLLWYDRSGKMLGTLGENDNYMSVSISRDGLRVAADTTTTNESKIRILDARGTRMLTTLPNSDGGSPTWSPDGRYIYFTSRTDGPQDVYVRASDGSGEEKKLLKFDKNVFGATLLAVSPDGHFLAYSYVDPTTNVDIHIFPLTAGEGKPQPFLHSAAAESAPAFSPDGRWLAYESNISGRNEVYITPFPSGGAHLQVSTNGGERPVWRRDGKEIYYREGLVMMAVEVKAKTGSLELSTPTALFEMASGNLNGRYYDVAADGRFLLNTSSRTARVQSFSLIVNWPTRLRR